MSRTLVGLVVVFLVVVLGCSVVLGCAAPALKSISASPAQVNLAVGGRQALAVAAVIGSKTETITPKKASYTSSDVKIATVNNEGNITGIAAGSATITVSYAKEYNVVKTATVAVTVK